jgi:hypothetical protein
MNEEFNTNVNEDEEIFSKVEELMNRLTKNQKLQALAEKNGLDVKNSIKLTDDSINNVAISVISLLLAKRSNDSRYKTLVNTGIQKRTLKTEIINDYKAQSIQLINRYKSNLKNNDIT